MHASVKRRRVKELYLAQAEISRGFLAKFQGKTLRVLCDGVNYEKSCFEGRAYFQAPEIDGKVFFTAPRAQTGSYYTVKIDRTDEYDLYGYVEE